VDNFKVTIKRITVQSNFKNTSNTVDKLTVFKLQCKSMWTYIQGKGLPLFLLPLLVS